MNALLSTSSIFAVPSAHHPLMVGVVVLSSGRTTSPLELVSEMCLVGLRETWWRSITQYLPIECVDAPTN